MGSGNAFILTSMLGRATIYDRTHSTQLLLYGDMSKSRPAIQRESATRPLGHCPSISTQYAYHICLPKLLEDSIVWFGPATL